MNDTLKVSADSTEIIIILKKDYFSNSDIVTIQKALRILNYLIDDKDLDNEEY